MFHWSSDFDVTLPNFRKVVSSKILGAINLSLELDCYVNRGRFKIFIEHIKNKL